MNKNVIFTGLIIVILLSVVMFLYKNRFTATFVKSPITVISPNGGEKFSIGSHTIITWRVPSAGFQSSVFIVDARDTHRSWHIWDTTSGRSREEGISWIVGQTMDTGTDSLSPGSYLIKVCEKLEGPKYENCDLSDAPFNLIK